MADWLDSLSRTMADSVVTTRWIHPSADGDSLPMVNVMASFNPSAPRRILYLAHWDTRPRADAAGSSDSSAVVPGANDNGSGWTHAACHGSSAELAKLWTSHREHRVGTGDSAAVIVRGYKVTDRVTQSHGN